MIIKYKYGFDYDGKLYGWKNKELYRLPQIISNRLYSKIKCSKWGEKGYYLGADRKSHKQLLAMTHYINHEEEVIDHDDCPF